MLTGLTTETAPWPTTRGLGVLLNADDGAPAGGGGDGGAPAGGGGDGGDDKPKDDETPSAESEFDAFLNRLDDEVRAAFETNVANLKAALLTERSDAKALRARLKAVEHLDKQVRDVEDLKRRLEQEHDDAMLEAAGEVKKLAEQRATRIGELESELETARAEAESATTDLESRLAEVTEERDALHTTVTADVDAELEALKLPEYVATPLEKMTLVEKRQWLTENREALQGEKPRGPGRTPRGGDGTMTPEQRAAQSARTW